MARTSEKPDSQLQEKIKENEVSSSEEALMMTDDVKQEGKSLGAYYVSQL